MFLIITPEEDIIFGSAGRLDILSCGEGAISLELNELSSSDKRRTSFYFIILSSRNDRMRSAFYFIYSTCKNNSLLRISLYNI